MAEHELTAESLHGSLTDPALESMNFLNEVALRYPEALSFASGRPLEEFFDVALLHEYIDRFCSYLRDECGYDQAQVNRTLFQYGRTKGIVHEIVARQLAADEGINADPEAIVVTVGFQEAMFIVARALRTCDRDVLLAVSPAYVGLTGAARLADLPVWPVRGGPDGIDVDDLASQVRLVRAAGLRPRACYVMPDFANPSGVSLTLELREALLDVAIASEILLLEDNPYGLFHDGPHLPTLKALEGRRGSRQVVYLGSFAKTAFPSARVGYAVADQRVLADDGTISLFADELSKIKSMVTVNTSAVAQAVVGGKLLRHDFSMADANRRETAAYLTNMRQLLDGLARRFAGLNGAVTWNVPTGGFFAVVTLPFPANDAMLERSARDYRVLWTPMSHFYFVADGNGNGQGEGLHQVRLACSLLTPTQIEEGLDRFAAFVTAQR
jgi:(S)-3,5-dihydroxyphenylglycine transaminase